MHDNAFQAIAEYSDEEDTPGLADSDDECAEERKTEPLGDVDTKAHEEVYEMKYCPEVEKSVRVRYEDAPVDKPIHVNLRDTWKDFQDAQAQDAEWITVGNKKKSKTSKKPEKTAAVVLRDFNVIWKNGQVWHAPALRNHDQASLQFMKRCGSQLQPQLILVRPNMWYLLRWPTTSALRMDPRNGSSTKFLMEDPSKTPVRDVAWSAMTTTTL